VVDPPRRGRRWVLLAGVVVVALAAWLGGRQWWAWQHLRGAEEALGRYDFDEALKHLESCLRVWSSSSSTRLLAARTARRAERFDRAEEHLAVCEQGPRTPEVALERFLLRAQQGDLGEVDVPLQQLIKDGHVDTPLIIEALARGYVRVFRHGQARGALLDLIERQPENPWAHFWYGQLYQDRREYLQAVPPFRRAVELAPRQALFRLHLAGVLVQTNQAREAWPYYEQLLGEAAAQPDVLLGAAACLRRLNQPAAAHEYLDTLLHDHPDHAEGWAERGRAFSDQARPAEAIRCLRKAFELDSGNYSIGFALFSELRARGEREADAVWQRIGALRHDEERQQQILDELGKQGRNAALRHELGDILLRSGSEAAALRWFAAALEDDPNHRPTHTSLAKYYQGKGNAEAAAYHSDRAAGRVP
jgi:tetratricopeptide (TPR) repeat protein